LVEQLPFKETVAGSNPAKRTKEMSNISQKILILNDIRSAQNVGSLFRTADACGIEEIYLSTITPQPIDRFGRVNTSVTKASLGAENSIEWSVFKNAKDLVTELKSHGYQIISIEQSESSTDYKKVSIKLPVAFILGNEVDGISKEMLEMSDVVAEIPMSGEKESLNVSVAGGVALFRMLGV
jgi:23S rRNA (guanosine2251-2'-O)-methyltransferase